MSYPEMFWFLLCYNFFTKETYSKPELKVVGKSETEEHWERADNGENCQIGKIFRSSTNDSQGTYRTEAVEATEGVPEQDNTRKRTYAEAAKGILKEVNIIANKVN